MVPKDAVCAGCERPYQQIESRHSRCDDLCDSRWNRNPEEQCRHGLISPLLTGRASQGAQEPAFLRELVEKWRDEANGVEATGYSQQADRMRDCADELDEALSSLKEEAHGDLSLKEFLDSQEFYELMQRYRHQPLAQQSNVTAAFEDVKMAILKHSSPKEGDTSS